VYMYGEKYNLVAQSAIGNEVARYGVERFIDDDGNSAISIRFYDGRPGQGVDQRLVDVTANLGNKWKATSKLSGMCYVVVERYYHLEFFRDAGKGKPDIDFVLRGLREYDPRKDSTVAGGSGTQRLTMPSTWVHTKNPALHRLNYQLGLRALVSGRTLIGEGKSLGQIDLATYFVAMNVCDTLRANGKKTYECSLFVSGDDDHTEVLKQFDDAMAGYGLNRRGLSGVIPGAPQIPVKDLTAADIPIDRAKDVQFRPSAFERFNHLSGQFTSIESMWNPESLKPVYVNADIAADGRNRQTSIDFLQVTDPDIAQYLLNIRYRQNRMGGKATVPVSRRFGLAVQEGEWITWRGKSWLISEWRADERLRITLVLSETSAAIYDDDGIEPGPIVVPPTPPINPSLLSTVQNFNVAAGMINGAQGYDTPALVFTWTPPDDPTITAVRFVYQIEGTTEIFEDQCTSPEDGSFRTTKNVVSGKVYNARATITTV
ncbi:phage tail protein, partial [Sinorhizobium medicae]|nr:phage tail protein [Sinorhizobium medicae]